MGGDGAVGVGKGDGGIRDQYMMGRKGTTLVVALAIFRGILVSEAN